MLETIHYYIEIISQLVFALVIVATLFVRITPSEKDNEVLHTWVVKIQKWMSYLPTLGVNPRTKKLEEALEDLKKNKAKVEEPKQDVQ